MRKVSAIIGIIVLSIILSSCGGGSPYEKKAMKGLEKLNLMLNQLRRIDKPNNASTQVSTINKSAAKLVKNLEELGEGKSSYTKIKVLKKKIGELGSEITQHASRSEFPDEAKKRIETMQDDIQNMIEDIKRMIKEGK